MRRKYSVFDRNSKICDGLNLFKLKDYTIRKCPVTEVMYNANFPPEKTSECTFSSHYYNTVQSEAFKPEYIDNKKDPYYEIYNRTLEGMDGIITCSKKSLFEVGLYDNKTFRIAGEDTDLRWKLQNKGYKLITTKVNILHLHGFYRLSFKEQLLNKALPLGEAIGVNFRKYGTKSFSSRYWNPISLTILYLFLILPYINIASFIIIAALALIYTIKVFKYSKDIKIIFVPFFKIAKDIITTIGFWKGFITKKQEF